MKKLKDNKGMSLVEILVSLAILSLSILTIANIVGVGINTNKRSEVKQQGLILGQQILEEIELLGAIDKYKNNITFLNMKLPSNRNFSGDSKNNEDKLKYKSIIEEKGIKYEVDIILNKNNYINFDNTTEDESKQINPDITLDFKTTQKGNKTFISIYKNNMEIKKDIEPSSISIKVLNDGINEESLIYINDNDESESPLVTFNGSKLMLNFTSDYKNEDGINIDLYNNLQPKLDLYVQKSYKCNEKINVINKQGNLSLVENLRDLAEYEENKISNLYEIKVTVKDNDKTVFEGHGNKNLNISK